MITRDLITPELTARLAAAGIADPARDLRKLFDWAYQQGAGAPQTRDDPNQVTRDAFARAVADRLMRKPVSQITGKRAFWRHDFIVTPDVLDPRPDTETLIEQALHHPFDTLLDLGTGSGAIAVSLLAERPGATGTATDISDAALGVAAQNARAIGVSDRLTLIRADWFAGVTGRFDLIVSNPPYIAAAEMPGLAPEVRDHEPHIALTPGGDGLDAYRAVAAQAADHLTPNGRLIVEIGPSQAAAVRGILAAAGFADIRVFPDIDRRDRVVCAIHGT